MAIILYDANGNPFAISVAYDSAGGAILSLVPQPSPLPPPAPIVPGGGKQGWTVTQIIKQVMGKTENRAANKGNFDPRLEFWTALDEFCGEKHYWWRRKAAALSVLVGVQDYDLSASGTGQANAGDCAEIEEMFVINGPVQSGPLRVDPLFSARDQMAALFGNNLGSQIRRSGYFLIPGQFQQLSFSSVPTQAANVAFTYYAIPMVTAVATDVVPLVPPFLHWGLFYMFERRIMEFLFSQSDPRWVSANKRYEDFKLIAAKAKSFSSQEAVEMRSTGPAVQSHGGRGWGGHYPPNSGTGGNPPF